VLLLFLVWSGALRRAATKLKQPAAAAEGRGRERGRRRSGTRTG